MSENLPTFRVRRWAAWAAGLPHAELWPSWLQAPKCTQLAGEAQPALTELSAMARRRIDPQGRAALQVAFRAQAQDAVGAVLYASRWGEIRRSVALLSELARGNPLSPTNFSLSVHNAAVAQYTIARAEPVHTSAISAGAYSASAALLEALGLLADGAQAILLISQEAGLPEPYADFDAAENMNVAPLRAWAAVIEPGVDFALCTGNADMYKNTHAASLPPDLELLAWLVGVRPQTRQGVLCWTRND